MSYKRQWWLSPFNWSFSSTKKTFSRDVEFALQEKKKCKESNKKFISVVASAVLVYNRYHSASIYENVGWAVLSKYAFLQSLQEQLRYHYGNYIYHVHVLHNVGGNSWKPETSLSEISKSKKNSQWNRL